MINSALKESPIKMLKKIQNGQNDSFQPNSTNPSIFIKMFPNCNVRKTLKIDKKITPNVSPSFCLKPKGLLRDW